MERMEQMFDRFLSSPVFNRLTREADVDRAARHTSLAAERAQALQLEATALERLRPLREKAEAKRRKAHEAAAAALAELAAVDREMAAMRHQTAAVVSCLDRELTDLADPRIADAEARLEGCLNAHLQQPPRRDQQTREGRHGPVVVYRSNRAGLRRLRSAVAEAKSELAALKTVLVDDLPEVISAIESRVPWDDANTMEFDDD